VVLDGEHPAGAAETGLHLVGHEQDSVLGAEGGQAGQERPGGRDVATFTEDRLDHDGRRLGRSRLAGQEMADLRQAGRRGGLGVAAMVEG
jgi:hypothetical protein